MLALYREKKNFARCYKLNIMFPLRLLKMVLLALLWASNIVHYWVKVPCWSIWVVYTKCCKLELLVVAFYCKEHILIVGGKIVTFYLDFFKKKVGSWLLFKQGMLHDSHSKFFIFWSLDCFYSPSLSAKVMAAATATQYMDLRALLACQMPRCWTVGTGCINVIPI